MKEKDLEIANGLIRSAFEIAKRNGKDTNWVAFRKQLDKELKRQHKILYAVKPKCICHSTSCDCPIHANK